MTSLSHIHDYFPEDRWTRRLPVVSGFFWFRDIDINERGIAFVTITDAYRGAEILIAESRLDDREYFSSAYWRADETIKMCWEWSSEPLEFPK